MPLTTYLYDVIILLIAAVGVVSALRALKISPILGFLLAGLLIGPYGFKLISSFEEVKVFAEFGVVFLLFTIGLELPLERLQKLKRYVFGMGFFQVLITTAVFSIIGLLMDLSLSAAVLVGGALSLSSTAIVLHLLAERDDVGTKYGRIGFSILLFQDLIVVVFLILLALVVEDENISLDSKYFVQSLTLGILKVVGVLACIALTGRYLLRPIYRWVANAKNAELFMALSLLLILTTSSATYAVGLSMELGAFLAGILLAETEYRHQVEADIQPFKGLLLGLFFMTIGMDLNMSVAANAPMTIMLGLVAFLLIKGTVIIAVARAYKIAWDVSIRLCFLLAAGGEFAFVLLTPLIKDKLLSPELAQILFLIVTLSMAVSPLLSFLGRRLGYKFVHLSNKHPEAIAKETADLKDHVILVGFGRVGHTVGKLLAQHIVPYVAIDLNMNEVAEGRLQGLPVYFGDARRAEIYGNLSIAKAQAVVITVDKPSTVARCVMMLRRHYPNIPLFVRAQDMDQARKLKKAGAMVIVPEMLEPSLQLAHSVMTARGIPSDQLHASLEIFRQYFLEGTLTLQTPQEDHQPFIEPKSIEPMIHDILEQESKKN